MHTQRNIVASLLIVVLIYGGLFAPLYHSVYMAMGDFYPASSHHGDQEACHDSPEAVAVVVDGAAMKAPHEGHPECPFMELFSISLLSYQLDSFSLGIEEYKESRFLSTANVYWQASAHKAYFLRGPPLA